MTFEQKVEKLRGIVDKKIAIWCERECDADELLPLLNNVNKEDFSDSLWSISSENSCYNINRVWDVSSLDYYERNDYQIIPYSEFFKVEDKPLEEWTLNEVKDYCDKFRDCENCDECVFYKNKKYDLCMFDINPYEWDFTPSTPSLTQSEIDILKAIKVLYGGDSKILYAELIDSFVDDDDTCQIPTFNIEADRLPSLSHDKEYLIDELLGV